MSHIFQRNPGTNNSWGLSACSRTQITGCLWPGYYTTTNHSYSGVIKESTVEWCSVDSNDESRFCMYASSGHTRVWHRSGDRYLPEWHSLTTHRPHLRLHGVGGHQLQLMVTFGVFLQGKVNSVLSVGCWPCTTAISSTGRWCAFSAEQHMSTYGCCDAACSSWCTITALASKIPRSLSNWTRMRHNEAGTYSFSKVCHNHFWIATTDARCLGQYIAGWNSAPLWLIACENTRLYCRQTGLHCVLMWLFEHSLLWHVFHLVWIYHHLLLQWQNTRHINIFSTMNLSLKVLNFFR